jgi:hypothetical protein
MPVNIGGPGVVPSLGALNSTTISLQSGEVYLIPSGRWEAKPGKYTTIQEYDVITTIWRSIGAGNVDGANQRIVSDGTNYRLANQTGCPIGAVVTTAGTGYSSTTPPTVAASAGGSVWKAIVGGAINTSVTVSNGGSGYTYPPQVTFSPPPVGGVPASGHCTLSAGAVSTITVDDQGAGYNAPPTVIFTNDPREGVNNVAVGTGAAAITTLTGSGTVTALICLDHGLGGQTAVPTLTFSSGSAAATAIMCWTITALVVSTTTAGSGYAAPVIISGYANAPTGSVLTNPQIQSNLLKPRNAFIVGATSGAALTATGTVIQDGGVYPAAPTLFAYGFIAGASPVQSVISAAVGGVTDVSLLFPT